jgi:hypothetical protein
LSGSFVFTIQIPRVSAISCISCMFDVFLTTIYMDKE